MHDLDDPSGCHRSRDQFAGEVATDGAEGRSDSPASIHRERFVRSISTFGQQRRRVTQHLEGPTLDRADGDGITCRRRSLVVFFDDRGDRRLPSGFEVDGR